MKRFIKDLPRLALYVIVVTFIYYFLFYFYIIAKYGENFMTMKPSPNFISHFFNSFIITAKTIFNDVITFYKLFDPLSLINNSQRTDGYMIFVFSSPMVKISTIIILAWGFYRVTRVCISHYRKH